MKLNRKNDFESVWFEFTLNRTALTGSGPLMHYYCLLDILVRFDNLNDWKTL